MILKDKSIYLNYAKDIETKVNNLCAKISLTTMQGPLKQEIEKIHVKILAKVFLIKDSATQETGLIPNSDWIQYQKDIDTLYKQLSYSINKALRGQKTQEIVR
ncbi:MAG: hypothetical protein R8N50_02630 [Alphaproteobacteria bacterium]|nr:hypothetical protein [Alphaproteobacteria bacterium]